MKIAGLFACALVGALGLLALHDAHDVLAPQPPFPPILTQAVSTERIAPGLELTRYRFLTVAGPLHANVLSLDPRRSGLALRVELASNALADGDESVAQIASRDPKSVAAVNGDYFAISGNGAPIGGVVSNSQLVRSPMRRAIFVLGRDGIAHISNLSLNARVNVGRTQVTLNAVDRHPYDGASLFLPIYGRVPALPQATILALAPQTGSPPFAAFRVLRSVNNRRSHRSGYYLAYGQSDANLIGLPLPGTTVSIDGSLAPLQPREIQTAFGGGPEFLHDALYQHDPNGPNGASFDARIPTTAIGITASHRILIVVIDGKDPNRSIGLSRRELASFMLALHAVDAMALDGGGSSTLLARTPGLQRLHLLNRPSDGKQRRVAEAIVVDNLTPIGAPVALAARPHEIHALVGAHVALRVLRVDAGLHPLGRPAHLHSNVEPAALGSIENGTFVARAPGRGRISLRSGALRGSIALDILAAPTSLRILPRLAQVAPSRMLQLQVHARDSRGFLLNLPTKLPWKASTGSIDEHGAFASALGDSTISLSLGSITAQRVVRVGEHSVELPLRRHAQFLSVPRGEPGSVQIDPLSGQLHLAYDFSGDEAAAFALIEQPLPPHTIALTFTVTSDGQGGVLRVAMRDARNDDVLLTAARLTTQGSMKVSVTIPNYAVAPLRLTGIYIVRALGAMPAIRTRGMIGLSDLRAMIAGASSTGCVECQRH